MRKLLRPVPLAVTVSSLVVIYALAGFFLVPYVIKAYVLPAVSDRLQRPVLVKEVAFNPFVLSLRITEFEIQERDHTPLLGFEELFVNFQAASLFRRAYVFRQIRMVVPFVSVKVGGDGLVNLSRLAPSDNPVQENTPTTPADLPAVEADQVKNAEPAELPPVEIGHFEIARGIVEFYDESKTPFVSTHIVPINLVLNNFHTKPGGGDNTYSFTAELGKDEILDWKGTLRLEPLASEGTLSLSGLKIATLFQHVRDRFQFDMPTGTIRAIGRYRFDAEPSFDFEISETLLHLTDIGIVEKGDSVPVVALHTLFLDGVHADLGQRKLEIESISLDKGTERVWRKPDGSLNVPDLFMPINSAPKEDASLDGKSPAWTVSIKDARITNHSIEFEDQSLPLPAKMKIANLSVKTHDVVFPFNEPIPLTVEHQLNGTGTVAAEGQLIMQPLQAELTLSLKDVAIQPFEPYIEPFARIAVDNGAIDLDGTLHFAAEHSKEPLMAFRGDFGVKALAIAERDQGEPLASWKHVQISNIAFTLDPTSVSIGEVGINQPTVHLAIHPDGVTNIKKLLPPAEATASEPSRARTKKGPPPSVTIKTVKVLRGTVTFQDDSISPAVQAGLHDLTGTVKGLSSKQIDRAEVDLSGKIDKVAPLKIAGTINPLTEDAFTDLTIKFDNVDLTAAAPYSGKYVGYPIRKGKLFLNLVYKVSQKQVEAENKVAVDQLTFGDKTDSPEATSLPVPLAVALLKDRQGRIDIDLPIRGDLKDPDFKYGKLVISSLSNLLTKMVSSPFSLMGKLVPGGGDGEALQHLTFEPGSTAIAPSEMKKIDALLRGLGERPGLRLEITGTADPTRDRQAVAIQRLQEVLRSRWQQENGSAQQTEPPVSAETRLITQLFDQWNSRQPAQIPDAAIKPPSMEEMKRKLAESIRVDDDALRLLARTRAEQIQAQMVGDGKLPEERVFLTDVDLATSEDEKVQSRLNITAGS